MNPLPALLLAGLIHPMDGTLPAPADPTAPRTQECRHPDLNVALEGPRSGSDCVVLLHGWWSSPVLLKPVTWRLRGLGYTVVPIAYPSVRMPLEEIATRFLPGELDRRLPAQTGRIHFVTHSMGGLVLRRYLQQPDRRPVGRVVMFGPPNQGSEAADFWARSRICRWIAGPNLRALGTGPDAVAPRLPPADFELLVLAGNRSFSPFGSPLPRPHDGRVSVASTRLEGMSAHREIPRTHTVLPWNRNALDLMAEFLASGRIPPEPRP